MKWFFLQLREYNKFHSEIGSFLLRIASSHKCIVDSPQVIKEPNRRVISQILAFSLRLYGKYLIFNWSLVSPCKGISIQMNKNL